MIRSNRDLKRHTHCSSKQLRVLLQNRHVYYNQFDKTIITLGKTKIRNIWAPRGNLKAIQNRIKDSFRRNIHFPDYVTGGYTGCSNFKNAARHRHGKFFLTIDIKDFFGSVKPLHVAKAFESIGCPDSIGVTLTAITTYNNELPKGASTSPYLANLILTELDKKIIDLISDLESDVVYTRYIDDLTFSSMDDISHLLNPILNHIAAHGFDVDRAKVVLTKGCCEITGIKVGGGSMRLIDKQQLLLDDPKTLISKKTRAWLNGYAKKIDSFS